MSPTAAEPMPTEGSAVISRMSYVEFLDWLDDDKYAEWVDGEVVLHSPDSRTHSGIKGFLLTIIQTFAE